MMRNLLIIYNVIFLLAGNVLFANIHHLHDHDHGHSHEHQTEECQECIIIENNNYAIDFQELSFSNNNTNLFISEYYTFVEFTIQKTFHSRAPPIS